MNPEQLRDIITTARMEIYIRECEYKRAEANARLKPDFQSAQNANELYGKRQGLMDALAILDFHIKRVYDELQAQRREG